MSLRVYMPARRPVSTMSPATAFCKSLRHASEMKSSATSGAQRVPCKAATTTLLAGVSGSVSRGLPRSHTDAPDSRCAGNQTTDGTTVAPAAYGANAAFCSTPFCSTQTTVFASHSAETQGAALAICVDLTATNTRSNLSSTTCGSVSTGPGTTISPPSKRSFNCSCAERPQITGVRPAS